MSFQQTHAHPVLRAYLLRKKQHKRLVREIYQEAIHLRWPYCLFIGKSLQRAIDPTSYCTHLLGLLRESANRRIIAATTTGLDSFDNAMRQTIGRSITEAGNRRANQASALGTAATIRFTFFV